MRIKGNNMGANAIKLTAEDFSLEMKAKVYTGDPEINNVLLWVSVVSKNFSGAMEMEVGTLGLDEFIRQMCSMNKDMKGSARIEEPYGNHCFIEFEMDRTGHITTRGRLVDFTHKMEFENTFDQTYLPAFVSKLCNTGIWQEEK